MKYLLIALIALTITLGVGCKKEKAIEPEKPKLKVAKSLNSRPGQHWDTCKNYDCIGCKLPKLDD